MGKWLGLFQYRAENILLERGMSDGKKIGVPAFVSLVERHLVSEGSLDLILLISEGFVPHVRQPLYVPFLREA